MRQIIDEMFQLKHWAVIGATTSQHKFGYKIFKKLRDHQYDVTPINPCYAEIDGVRCYSNLFEQTQSSIEVVNVVVPPALTLKVLDDIAQMKIQYVWFQPGTYDEAVIKRAMQHKLKVVYGYCVLMEL